MTNTLASPDSQLTISRSHNTLAQLGAMIPEWKL